MHTGLASTRAGKEEGEAELASLLSARKGRALDKTPSTPGASGQPGTWS